MGNRTSITRSSHLLGGRGCHASAQARASALGAQGLGAREAAVATREATLRDAEGDQARRDCQVAQLCEANEKLVIASVLAQTMRDQADDARALHGHAAHHDALTGLPNRVLLLEKLNTAIAVARHHGSRLAVLFLDLDRFKVVNDSMGHAAGDTVLIDVSHRISTMLRATDVASRQGAMSLSWCCRM